MSTKQLPCVVNGFVPDSVPRRRRNVAEMIVAPSGIDDVSNDTNDFTCWSLVVSPARSADVVDAVALTVPPAFDVSLLSVMRPSCAPTDVKVTVMLCNG